MGLSKEQTLRHEFVLQPLQLRCQEHAVESCESLLQKHQRKSISGVSQKPRQCKNTGDWLSLSQESVFVLCAVSWSQVDLGFILNPYPWGVKPTGSGCIMAKPRGEMTTWPSERAKWKVHWTKPNVSAQVQPRISSLASALLLPAQIPPWLPHHPYKSRTERLFLHLSLLI